MITNAMNHCVGVRAIGCGGSGSEGSELLMKEFLEKFAEEHNSAQPPHACIETSDGLLDLEFDEESNAFYLMAESGSIDKRRIREVACISLSKGNLIELIEAAKNALSYLSDRLHQSRSA